MVQELIQRVFATRNAAHLAHWAETSGYRHTVLGEFYDDVIDSIDKFVEAYQGNFGTIEDIKLKDSDKDIMKLIEDDIVWITTHCEEICEDIEALENILQELTGLYLSTRFKLKQLK